MLLEAHRCLHDDGLLFVKDLYSTIEPMEEEQEQEGYGGKEWEEQGKELRATQLALLQQFSLNFKMAYHTTCALIRLIEACGFECQFVALEEDKDSDVSTSFAKSCFKAQPDGTMGLSMFGKEILKNSPTHKFH